MKNRIAISKILIIALLYLPFQSYSQGIMVPNGLGAWGNMVYTGMGFTAPQPYYDVGNTTLMDMVGSLGFGIGNPAKNIGVQIGSNMLDVSEQDLYNVGAKIHRYVGHGISIGVGVENVFVYGKTSNEFFFNTPERSDASMNYYGAISHNFSDMYPPGSFISRLSYTIGGGSGRFSQLAQMDVAQGNDNKGTYAFAAVRLALVRNKSIIDNFNLHTEWTGTNMNAGFTLNSHLGPVPVTLAMLAADLTPYSGDQPRFVGAVGVLYQFGGKNKKKRGKHDDELEKIIEQHELLAQNENLKKQNDNIRDAQDELLRKIDVLEKQVQELKNRQGNIRDDNLNVEPDNPYDNENNTDEYKEPDVDGAVNMDEDYIIKVNDGVDAGYNIEPGNYVVIHSIVKRKWAENAVEQYRKIGVDTKIVYNKDKQIHYIYTDKYQPNEIKTALQKSTEMRKKGFEGAWVFIKKKEDEEGYYYRTNIDSILDLPYDKIVKINAGDSTGYLIDHGYYVIVSSIKKKLEAEQAERSLNSQGIRTQIIYNQDREQHYIYTQKYPTLEEALVKRSQLQKRISGVWILKRDTEEVIPGEEILDKARNMRANEIVKVEKGVKHTANIEPGYYLVIEAFESKDNALRAEKLYKEQGYPIYIAYNKDRKMYYVYTHMFNDREKALNQLEKWKAGDFEKAWIFTY